MDANRLARLTRSQRESLRLYHQRYKLKTIAEMMDGISPNTVGSYLTEAVAVLDAPGRPAAAAMLAAYEAAHPESRGRFSADDNRPSAEVIPVPTEGAPARPSWPWQAYLPFRTSEGSPSAQSPFIRLAWIVVIAVVLAIGFGELANAAHLITDLAARAAG